MLKFLLQTLTWWHGQTLGTRFFTFRKGEFVGTDGYGNRYFRCRDASHNEGERRWVIYAGESEASMVPPLWYGWLHHTTNDLPEAQDAVARDWHRPHLPNMTGTAAAYHPAGSMAHVSAHGGSQRPRTTGDYEAWTP